jgi:hypothetical protein
MYIRPKITYPFPCVSMTENQCRHIQAPVLEAILPKLHLNRHSPRAVLFAGPRYGGLSLAENYTDFGFGHLQYLLGHIKMGDDVGQLFLSLITHTELEVGSTTSFFHLPFPSYMKWIDAHWITDVWKFTHRARIEVDIENQWKPRLLRQNDCALMDFAVTLHLNAYQLRCINTCRLYLQVLTVSDIATADGKHLLESAVKGQRDCQRRSTLLWPQVPCPPRSFWLQWSNFLEHLSRGRRLIEPLGQWIATPQCDWRWYIDSAATVWEKDWDKENTWVRYHVVDIGGRRTHRSTKQYNTGMPDFSPSPEHTLYPVTILPLRSGNFTVAVSSTPFVASPRATVPNLWRHADIPPALADTPPFFQHLLSSPLTDQECQEIASELAEHSLVACSDGACDIKAVRSSHGFVFASSFLR